MTGNENVNITFDGWRSYDDWGLMLEKIEISFPEPKENKVSIPGMDGTLDLSEILSPMAYEERIVCFNFSMAGRQEDFRTRSSLIADRIHGRKVKIIVGTDPGYYYLGRMRLESSMDDDVVENLTISGSVEPYKYEVNDGSEDWEWDTFDLENGVIREYKDLLIIGNRVITVIGRRKRVIPSVTCSARMALFYNGTTINLPAGTTKLYELQIGEGEHDLTFVGNGTVTISYRGGIL